MGAPSCVVLNSAAYYNEKAHEHAFVGYKFRQ